MSTDTQPNTILGPGIVVQGIRKRYGHVTALAGANLNICFGMVTALVGDNGAGKSTLVKVISGAIIPDSGTIEMEGRPVTFDSPKSARRQGVHTVYQDLALADNLDVVENLFLGSETRKRAFGFGLPWLDRRAMELSTEDLLARLGITTIRSLRQRLELLSGGQRQTVAIARAVREKASIVILDEPTAALGVHQSAQVMATVHRLRAEGTGVLLVSHNLHEVFAVADRIAVMRLGLVTEVFLRNEAEEGEVVAAIMGAREVPSAVAGVE